MHFPLWMVFSKLRRPAHDNVFFVSREMFSSGNNQTRRCYDCMTHRDKGTFDKACVHTPQITSHRRQIYTATWIGWYIGLLSWHTRSWHASMHSTFQGRAPTQQYWRNMTWLCCNTSVTCEWWASAKHYHRVMGRGETSIRIMLSTCQHLYKHVVFQRYLQ